jgi:putative hydrolase of the HAD superfamily
MPITTLAFDGDDTLWHSETHFAVTTDRMIELVAPWIEGNLAVDALLDVERRNLSIFGYGVKAFILSMIETVIEVTDGQIPSAEIHKMIAWAKELLDHPVELMSDVPSTLDAVAGRYQLMVITKGDLLHQESKVARSGLSERFDAIEIVADKDTATYERILQRHGINPTEFAMVGNSLRSDVAPVVALGGWGIHVPFHLTWALEHLENDDLGARALTASGLRDVPEILERIGTE